MASGEVELVDAEAFLLSGDPSSDKADAQPADGKGLGRMMELTNAARLGIALFAVGNARRALVESLCYARQRRAFHAIGDAALEGGIEHGARAIDHDGVARTFSPERVSDACGDDDAGVARTVAEWAPDRLPA